IVSDQYLTKVEVREILAEAKKYGIKVIPSFDSPGHVDQILKAHPEYGQVNTSGNHYKSGLDVTNPEAIAYIRSLYDEYMDLFEGCTDFHIGGDEYMEFDRAPFTTEYKSVLNSYAVKKYGQGYIWKDVIAGYINDLAEYVHDRGFTPRIWNDGVYYGESSYEGAQNKNA
ncbi:MAG: family 20 glycosylhydrolase, partial [Faecalibacillus sp.]